MKKASNFWSSLQVSNNRNKTSQNKIETTVNTESIFKLLLLTLTLGLSGVLGAASTNIGVSGAKQAEQSSSTGSGKDVASLQAELNSIVQQHDLPNTSPEANNQRKLTQSIINKLIAGSIGSNDLGPAGEDNSQAQELMDGIMIPIPAQTAGEQVDDELYSPSDNTGFLIEQPSNQQSSVNDEIKLKKFWNMVKQFYENGMINPNNRIFGQLPLPTAGGAESAVTMKRAAARMGAYLHNQQRSPGSYPRNSFDFGLGKRFPEDSSNSLLRYGDVVQSSNSFGKRPASHRYDFGLGKRLASPSYPRYDFGLGKRAPSRTRYDFGLGK